MSRYDEDPLNENNPWIKEIIHVQNEISSLKPNPHYLKLYRQEECNYWPYISQWLYQDRSLHTINKSLDIGCAYGTLSLYSKLLLQCDVYCTDFTNRYISSELINKYNFQFTVNNIELDPFPWNEKFDVIIFTEVLEHLNFHPVATLSKIRDLLTDDGKLYLSTPDAATWGRVTKYYPNIEQIPYPDKNMPTVDDHVYVYTKKELLDVLEDSVLQVERIKISPSHKGYTHFNLTVCKK